MPEYIDKQHLMKNFCGYDLTKCQKYGNTSKKQLCASYSTLMMYEIADEIDNAHIENVIKVVRCCDCIHNNLYTDEYGNGTIYCTKNDRLVDPMDYCSLGVERGKRK